MELAFTPRASEQATYSELFALWRWLHDALGRESDLMKRLRRLRGVGG